MRILQVNVIVLIMLQLVSCNNLQKNTQFNFRKGDLIFQDLSGDSISEAIESVTGGEQNLNFSHVGIVDVDSLGNVYVLEAVSKGVAYHSLDEFMKRSNRVAIGRLKKEYTNRIDEAISYGKSLIGLPYDEVYRMGDNTYYCSELIYEMFRNTGDTTEIFYLRPMSFKDPSTNEFLPFWIDYYEKLGVDIPEGEPGLNPNGMYQSARIDIVFPYGKLKSD